MKLFDLNSKLWDNHEDSFFRDLELLPMQRKPKTCVATSLAVITGESPEYFQGRINTQDPVSWSKALEDFGMKLSFCPTDIRKLKYYLPELVNYNDLFLISFYSSEDSFEILNEPNAEGWLTSSHLVILHKNKVIDTKFCTKEEADLSYINNFHTKRILRVIRTDCLRGI